MALLMFDGFEAYPSANSLAVLPVNAPWKQVGFTSTVYNPSRTGSRAVSNGPTITKDLGDPATLYVGFGWRPKSYDHDALLLRGDAGGNVCVLSYETATEEYVLKTGAGSEVHRGSLAVDTYHYVEIGLTVNGATSSVELRINGAQAYADGSLDMEVGANVGVRDALFIDSTAGYSTPRGLVDDVYLCDGSGTEHNTFLGPVRVHALSPNADAAVTWTPKSGANNYSQVDDLWGGHDGDGTYAESSTVGDKDFYDLTDLAAEYQNPVAVQTYWAARHDDSSGGAGMAALLKSGATEVEGSEVVLTSSYLRFAEPQQVTNPDTGAAWTPAEVNALQIGAIVKSNL